MLIKLPKSKNFLLGTYSFIFTFSPNLLFKISLISPIPSIKPKFKAVSPDQKDPEKTYITRATPRQAEMFQEMLPDHLTDDKKKTPGAGGFLTAFTNKTFDF